MPCEVIPFPAEGTARGTEPIIACHHIELQLGRSRYDVDVIGFVKPLPGPSALSAISAFDRFWWQKLDAK